MVRKLILSLLLLWSAELQAQVVPVRVELLNQYAMGDKVYFDVYLRTTDGSGVYLGQTGVVVSFDTTAFNNPKINFDPTLARLRTIEGRTVSSSSQVALLKDDANRNIISLNYLAPYVETETQVKNGIAYIDSRVNAHCLGRISISGYNQSIADVNLRVVAEARTMSHLATVVNLYAASGDNGGSGQIDPGADSTFFYLRLGTFTAVPAGRSAELEWTTQNEVRMNSFEIERSIYPDQNFVRIGTMPSKGFPNTLSVYRVVDRDVYNPSDPIPTYYYRIKYIAEDGTTAYSPVRAVDFNAGNEIDLVTWPNPTSDAVNMQLRNVIDETILVRLLDRKGSELGQKRFTPNEIIRFEVASLVPGVYFIEVITSKGKRTEKIVVWR